MLKKTGGRFSLFKRDGGLRRKGNSGRVKALSTSAQDRVLASKSIGGAPNGSNTTTAGSQAPRPSIPQIMAEEHDTTKKDLQSYTQSSHPCFEYGLVTRGQNTQYSGVVANACLPHHLSESNRISFKPVRHGVSSTDIQYDPGP